MHVPARSASDISRYLGVDRQRLHPYVRRSGAEPVRREGNRLLYDGSGQALILHEFHEALLEDSYCGGPAEYRERERAVREALYRLALGVDRTLVEEWADWRGGRLLLPLDWVRRLLAGTLPPDGLEREDPPPIALAPTAPGA